MFLPTKRFRAAGIINHKQRLIQLDHLSEARAYMVRNADLENKKTGGEGTPPV
jgi:hypothetical protein